ncbi:MAG: PH domain-containing protein [Muribaculaceae bacterium]|nr:PH domain-containing protein [Muribaculaceae bacterium]
MIFSLPPAVFVLFLGYTLWSRVTYTVSGKTLLASTPMKSLTINIESIKKIRRGKFWVDRGHNYSASRIKLRIVYDRSSYIYVSPDREDLFTSTLRTINPSIAFSSERGL